MYKPKRDSYTSPYIIDNQVWVDQGNSYGFEVIKTVDYKKLLDISPCIQACVVGDHLLTLSVNEELGGSCNIDHRLRSMKIDELICNSDLVGHLLVVENKNVHYCRLVDDELRLIRQVAKNVEAVIIVGTYVNIDLVRVFNRDAEDNTKSIKILTLLSDERLMLVEFSITGSNIMRGEVKVPEGVKWIEGGSHNRDNATIVTNTDRVLTLVSRDTAIMTKELVTIPNLVDIVRRDCYWLALTYDSGYKLFIVITREDGIYMNASSGGRYQPKISPTIDVPRCDAKFEVNTMGLRFKKFINKDILMTVSGNIYEYEHALHIGRTLFHPIDKHIRSTH